MSEPPRTSSAGKSLSNSILRATFDARGLASLTLLLSAAVVQVQDDNFALGLGGTILSSASLPNPTKTALAFRYTSGAHSLSIDVAYSLGPSDSFVTKSLTVTSSNSTCKPSAAHPPPTTHRPPRTATTHHPPRTAHHPPPPGPRLPPTDAMLPFWPAEPG